VNASIYRIVGASLLASSLMAVSALPLLDLVYRRGHLQFADSQANAIYFFWFSLSLVFWSAQGLYARAFYAAGNTLTPMIASTIVTLASLPLYSLLYRHFSAIGLVIASDLGIAGNCLITAYLLNRRGLVPVDGLEWKEIGKALIVSGFAGWLSWRVSQLVDLTGSRAADVKALALMVASWGGATALGLWITKSKLPADLRRRKTAAVQQ
jgi:putative peptidoglycan lipid II flippase